MSVMNPVGMGKSPLFSSQCSLRQCRSAATSPAFSSGNTHFCRRRWRHWSGAFTGSLGVDPAREQGWQAYTMAMLAFSLVGFASLYALQRLQNLLPLDPQGFDGVPADLAFNTSLSFITNTNWQNYSGEATMSHLTQMLGLTVTQFHLRSDGPSPSLSRWCAASHARNRRRRQFLGRSHARDTLPAVALVHNLRTGPCLARCPADLAGQVEATTLEGAKQVISIGPVASQEAIKELGTNGGGFFNVNSAHPFENPNAVTNMLEIFALLVIPFASVFAFGRAVLDPRQGTPSPSPWGSC